MRALVFRSVLRISPRAVAGSAAAISFTAGIGILAATWFGSPNGDGATADRLGAALALLLGGLSLGLLRDERPAPPRQWAGTAGAGAVTLIGLITLLAHGAQSGGTVPQRPSFHAGLILGLTGLALAAMDVRVRRGPQPAPFLALLAFIVAGVALLGHASGAPLLYAMSDAGVPWPVALTGAVLSAGVLCARPDAGFVGLLRARGSAGFVARTLVLAPLLVPMGMGLVILAGQRAGVLGLTASAWIFQMAYFGGFTFIIWWVASVIRRTELETARHQAHFRAVAETAAQAIISGDQTGRVTYLNPAGERMFGRPAAEIVGRPLVSLWPERFLADHQRELDRVLTEPGAAGLGRTTELVGLRNDGTEFPIEFSLAGWRAGAEPCFSVILSDIGDRKRAAEALGRLNAELTDRLAELARTDEALRASEEQLRLLVEGVRDYAILMLDPDGRVTTWNDGAERIKGYAAGEIIGHHFSLFYPPEVAERGHPARELETARSEGRCEDEGWRVRKDGSRFWADVVINAIRDGTGALRGYSKVTRDVTDRKRGEDEVRRLNADLEERVRERTAELEAANRNLAEKNAENEMFVYSVSHDLRSPLVNLQGFSKELEKACRGLTALLDEAAVPSDVRDRGRGLLDGKIARSVGFIQSAVLRLSGIIDALLRLSRAGRIEYRREVVDVGRLAGHVVGAAQGTITERGAVVRVGELPPAWGDRTAIEQVFGNLIGNALTYLDPARPGVIEVGCLPPDGPGFRTYFVRDNGLGIAESHRQKIFQAFQRAHPGVGSGEGLGLAIVSRVAERHRGRVWVESKPGEGSTFFVTLPTDAGGR